MPFDFTSDKRPKVSVSLIDVKPGRARKNFSKLMDLKNSIEEMGLLQPVVLNAKPDGRYDLMAGETRYKAFMLVQNTGGQIPFTWFNDLTDLRQKEIELEENLCRSNLEPLEQIELMAQIDDLKRTIYGDQTRLNPDGWSTRKTAELIGLSPESQSNVARQIKLAKKLRDRPELRSRIENLPVAAAVRVVEAIESAEATGRLVDSGELKLTHELSNVDALSFLKTLASDSIDLHLTDPPFGMNTIEDRKTDVAAPSQSYMAQVKPDDNLSSDDALTLMSAVIPELFRTLKPGGHCYMFFELELLGEIKAILLASGFDIQWPVLIWDKCRTTVPGRGTNYGSCYEAIFYVTKGKDVRRLSENSAAIIKEPAVHASKKLHIFEKPLALLAGFIKRSSNMGDLVCDCFAGSGSTLLAAKQCGRRAIGTELDKEHYLKAQGRLLQATVEGVVE